MVHRPNQDKAAGEEQKKKWNTVNPIFKFISEALFQTKRHEKVVRKILAAYLKTNWHRYDPDWHSGGSERATALANSFSSGHCTQEEALRMASDLFGNSINGVHKLLILDESRHETCRESAGATPSFISANKLEILGDSNMATASPRDGVVVVAPGSPRTDHTSAGACREAIKMAPASSALKPLRETSIMAVPTTADDAKPDPIKKQLKTFSKENFDLINEGNPAGASPSRGARKDWCPGGARWKVYGSPPRLGHGAFDATVALVQPSKITREEVSTPWRRPSDDDAGGRGSALSTQSNCDNVASPTHPKSASSDALCAEDTIPVLEGRTSVSIGETSKNMCSAGSSENNLGLYTGLCKCGKIELWKHRTYSELSYEEGVKVAQKMFGKIFQENKPFTWGDRWGWELGDYLFDWHDIHILDKKFWCDKKLIDLIPEVLENRTKNKRRCQNIFAVHQLVAQNN